MVPTCQKYIDTWMAYAEEKSNWHMRKCERGNISCMVTFLNAVTTHLIILGKWEKEKEKLHLLRVPSSYKIPKVFDFSFQLKYQKLKQHKENIWTQCSLLMPHVTSKWQLSVCKSHWRASRWLPRPDNVVIWMSRKMTGKVICYNRLPCWLW